MPAYEYTLMPGGWKRTKIRPTHSVSRDMSPQRLKASGAQQHNPNYIPRGPSETSMTAHVEGSPPNIETRSLPYPIHQHSHLKNRFCDTPHKQRNEKARIFENFGADIPYHQKHQERTRKHGPRHLCCIPAHSTIQDTSQIDSEREAFPKRMDPHALRMPCKNCGHQDNLDLQQTSPFGSIPISGMQLRYPGRRVLSFAAAWHEFNFHLLVARDFFDRFDTDFRKETQLMATYAHMGTINQMWENKILQNEKYGGRSKAGLLQNGSYLGGNLQRSRDVFENGSQHAHQSDRVGRFDEVQCNLEKATLDILNSQLLPPRPRGHYELDIGDDDDYTDPRDILDLLQYRNAHTTLERIGCWINNLSPLLAEIKKSHHSMKLLLAELKYMVDTITNSRQMLPGVPDPSASSDSLNSTESLNAVTKERSNQISPRGRSRHRSRSRTRERDSDDKSNGKEKSHEDGEAEPKAKGQTKGKGKTRSGD